MPMTVDDKICALAIGLALLTFLVIGMIIMIAFKGLMTYKSPRKSGFGFQSLMPGAPWDWDGIYTGKEGERVFYNMSDYP